MPPLAPRDSDEPDKFLQLKTKQAFSVLYDNYASALFGVVCHFAKNEDDANTLFENAFIEIWKNIGLHDATKQRLLVWMVGITCRICREYLVGEVTQQPIP